MDTGTTMDNYITVAEAENLDVRMEPRGYVRDYLSNLQPYMLERFPSQEVDKSYICVLDQMYRVSLYIKIDKSFGSEIIVSFHENNKRGIAKENNMLRPSGEEVVPVIADSIASKVIGTENYAINILMQRGILLLLPTRSILCWRMRRGRNFSM